MLRKVVGAMVLLLLCIGFTLADEINAIITKVDGDKVTFAENKGKGERGDSKTLPVADGVKVVKGKKNKETKKVEAGDPLDGGLKNDVFTKIGEKGVAAQVITDGDNKKITEIRVFQKKKKDNN